ncbi:MAG: PAS domain-containing protein [Actinobacteria bacterium]|nr:PAS domain-containing protein [Actinomycetota bacterium]MBV9255521.1 PAS domain-containing protein [Actinomycetota bacterium]
MSPAADPQFESLLEYLRDDRGFDFTGYKRSTLMRRIQKRMQIVNVDGFDTYRTYLAHTPEEFTELFNTILINVTGFFRDPEAWEFLAADVLPRVLNGKQPGDAIRLWSAGSSGGQEAYSIAILVCEAIGEERFRNEVKIYATDVDEEALTQARHARYTEAELQPAVSDQRLERFFETSAGQWTFRNDLRRSIIFGRHDLMQNPPISRIDLLVCRNTLMYFTAGAQRRILANFHFALNPTGVLFLGKSEAIVTRTNLFEPVDLRWHLFSKADNRGRERPQMIPMPPGVAGDGQAPAREMLQHAGFDTAPVAQVVIDHEGTLLLANTQARSLFGLTVSQIGRPLKDLELSYRPVELRSAIDEVMSSGQLLRLGETEWRSPTGEVHHLNIELTPLRPQGPLVGVSVTFTDLTRFRLLEYDFERSQRELETAYEELQSTVEELETTNEELQSTNEELETTNEELHSTNEELETMNEELQSTNEELETTNNELRVRTTDLNHANAFLESILGSLAAAVIVLDQEMAVRVWNHAAEEMWGLRSDEVTGQHFMNLDIGLPVEQLRRPVRDCLAGGETSDAVVVAAVNRRGRSIECSVVVSPLNQHDGIEGVIVVVEVVTAA